MKFLKDELEALKKGITQKMKQEQIIDNCSTRDGLYQMYHQLSRDIDAAGKLHPFFSGPFEGTEDELWAFRDHVIVRLAVFEAYGKALKEAQKAEVDL